MKKLAGILLAMGMLVAMGSVFHGCGGSAGTAPSRVVITGTG